MTPATRLAVLDRLHRINPAMLAVLAKGKAAPRCAVCGALRHGHPTCGGCGLAIGVGHVAGERLTGGLCGRCVGDRQRRMRR